MKKNRKNSEIAALENATSQGFSEHKNLQALHDFFSSTEELEMELPKSMRSNPQDAYERRKTKGFC